MLKSISCLAALCLLAVPCSAEDGDDTLQVYLNRSTLVVMGELQEVSAGEQKEAGTVPYHLQFGVKSVLKGEFDAKKSLDVLMMRSETRTRDRSLVLRKQREYLLFLKSSDSPQTEGALVWKPADPWFGVLPHNPRMAESLARVAGTLRPVPAAVTTVVSPAQTPVETTTTSARSALNTDRLDWKKAGDSRRQAHDRDGAAEWVGQWRLFLPAGFQYDMTLTKDDEGLLKLDSATKGTLLGTFACVKNQLQLVKPFDDGIDDFVWQLNDEGNFVLVTDRNRVGASYLGAVLERKR